MKNILLGVLIALLIGAVVYIIVLRKQKQEVLLLRLETEALYKIKADLEKELIKLDKKNQINKIHEKYRQEFMDSDFVDKLEHIRLSDVEALRVFDRYDKRRSADQRKQ
jgi:uncharacterized membrane protein YraQ (UPF0718 family)